MNRDEPETLVHRAPHSFARESSRSRGVYESEASLVEDKVKRIGRALAAFLFPTTCVACGRRRVERFFEGGVCASCWEGIPFLHERRCAICGDAPAETMLATAPAGEWSQAGAPEPAAAGAELPCGRCLLDPPAFCRLAAAAPYRGCAREMLLAFKFRGADYLAPRIARLLVRRLAPIHDIGEVTAVPAIRRARWTSDHAAELLGAAVARELGAPFAPRRLAKIRATERQSALPAARRAANVRGAFRARGRPAANVLLVDDVATSGSTARECARVLRNAGARSVEVWCFARAARDELDRADA